MNDTNRPVIKSKQRLLREAVAAVKAKKLAAKKAHEETAKENVAKVQAKAAVTEERIKEAVQEITHPNPVPTKSPLDKLKAKIAARNTEAAKAQEQQSKLEQVKAKLRERAKLHEAIVDASPEPAYSKRPLQDILGTYSADIEYNEEQQAAIQLGASGKPFVLIGSAGTGKTTTAKAIVKGLLNNTALGLPPLQANDHKHLVNGSPGIVICSFTRRAVANIRKQQEAEMKANCLSIHKLLEYQPETITIEDEETGEERTTRVFTPNRTKHNPLPTSIHTIIIEEAGTVGIDLFNLLLDALSHKVQFIFLGDIQQLAPVFGPPELGFRMLDLPTIQLTQVYRQALESPIIRLAQRVLSGQFIPVNEYSEWYYEDKLKIHPWKKKISGDAALNQLSKFFRQAYEAGQYDPNNDAILIPYAKACGSNELSKRIANFIARAEGRITHEVVAGFNKHYFSEGDRVLFDKEEAIITAIEPNLNYTGSPYLPSSTNLDYWGHNPKAKEEAFHREDEEFDAYDIDAALDAMLDGAIASDKERVTQASHNVTIRYLDDDGSIADSKDIVLDKASQVNNMDLAYSMTVYKSQGSEFRKVFFILHQSHNKMTQRELLYTGITRAKEELYIICEPETFTSGIRSQKIKGNTLAEKMAAFTNKIKEGDYKDDWEAWHEKVKEA